MRFDLDPFDRSPFDRIGDITIYLSGSGDVQVNGIGDLMVGAIYLSGSGNVRVSGSGDLQEVIKLSGSGNVRVDADGHLTVSALLSGEGNVQVEGGGDITNYVLLSGSGKIQTDANGDLFVYAEVTFTFGGSLAAGKTLVIDTNDYTALNNGVNAIASMTGEFPLVFPGDNQVIYSDSEGSRTVKITIVKKDRSV